MNGYEGHIVVLAGSVLKTHQGVEEAIAHLLGVEASEAAQR